MSIISYENRYLLMLLAIVINQKPVHILKRQIQWETILRLADYHNIITPIYYGVLGVEKEVTEDFQNRFYLKYRREMLMEETYREVEKVIIWQLERHKIHSLLLTGTAERELYLKPEWGYTGGLEFLAEKKYFPKLREIMTGMDYEEQENRVDDGLVFTRVPGVRIVFYDRIPVQNRVLKRHLSGSVKKHMKMDGQRYLRTFRQESEYLYRIGRLEDAYILGELRIRSILDFWQYMLHIPDDFLWGTVEEVLEKAKLVKFVDQVEILASIWFGSQPEKETRIAFALEDYIFSKGRENPLLDEEILPHERAAVDFYWRDRDREWQKKQKQWLLFPTREYMARYYPILEKHPSLLWICWLFRGLRTLRHLCLRMLKKAKERAKERKKQFLAKLREHFLRKNKEEPEDGSEKETPPAPPDASEEMK